MNLALLLAAGFLFLKTGEKFATQESAGPTVALLTAYLGQQTGVPFEPRVLNDPGPAAEYCAAVKPAAGIVTPGFYLAYGRSLGMEPILEIVRQPIVAERYVLVTKGAELAALTNQPIATLLAAEPHFVTRVILQGKLGATVQLQPITDTEGAVMDLVEGAKNAAAAVLLEAGAWQVIQADPELGPQLKVVFTSDELPGNLVVLFPGSLPADKLKAALQATPVELRDSVRVAKFNNLQQDRLQRASALFHGQ